MVLNQQMLTTKLSRAALLGIAASLLGACSSEPTCDYSKERYMQAESVPSLRAPAGLTAPDRTASLVIPPAPKDAKLPSGKGACLDRPPSYFATKPASADGKSPPATGATDKAPPKTDSPH